MNNNVIVGGSAVGVTAFLLAGIMLLSGDVLAYPQPGNATILSLTPEDSNTLRVDWEFYVYLNATEHVKITDRFFVPSSASKELIEDTFLEEVNKTFEARYVSKQLVVNNKLQTLKSQVEGKSLSQIKEVK